MKTALVIMAAGIGSRFGGVSNSWLLPVSTAIMMTYLIHGMPSRPVLTRSSLSSATTLRRRLKRPSVTALRRSRARGVETELARSRHRERRGLPCQRAAQALVLGRLGWPGVCIRYEREFAVINADDLRRGVFRLHDFRRAMTRPTRPGGLFHGARAENTLSDNGAVTRGICQMNDAHYLTGVLETGGIEKTADGAAAGGKSIDIDSLVSMNMWASTSSSWSCDPACGVSSTRRRPANPLKAEYLLPIYIDELLHADKVSVKVLPTHDKWFGVTYAEDKQTVIDSFARLVADGVYKKDLFSDLKK